MVPFRPTAELYQGTQGCNGSPYIGRYPDRSMIGVKYLGLAVPNWKQPWEPPELGCPRSYYTTFFIDSLDKYRRRRDANGGRVPNPRFDSAEWQVQALVMALEEEEERVEIYIANAMLERSRREHEAAAAAAKQGNGLRIRGRQARR